MWVLQPAEPRPDRLWRQRSVGKCAVLIDLGPEPWGKLAKRCFFRIHCQLQKALMTALQNVPTTVSKMGNPGVKKKPASDISLCIVSWNVREDLWTCLDSLFGRNNQASLEVIVVDNGSSDGTVATLPDRFPQAKLIANEENQGFAAASNQAIAASRSRYYFLLNPDTIVPEGGLDELLRFADDHPEAGIVAPRLVCPDGSLQYSCRRFPTISAAVFRGTFLELLIPGIKSVRSYLMSDWDHGQVCQVDWVSGAAMLVRRELIDDIGRLDERFFWGSEDVDFCLRAHQAGRQVLYTPQPEIIHAIGRSAQQAELSTIIHAHRSMYRLHSKHWGRWLGSRWLIWIGIWLRAAVMIGHWLVRRVFRGGEREDEHDDL